MVFIQKTVVYSLQQIKIILVKGAFIMACNKIITIGRQFGSGGREVGQKLAEKLGVSHRHLGDLERGSSNGSVKILIDIAEYFHVSMDYLLLGRDPSRDQFQNELQAAIDHLEKIKGLL